MIQFNAEYSNEYLDSKNEFTQHLEEIEEVEAQILRSPFFTGKRMTILGLDKIEHIIYGFEDHLCFYYRIRDKVDPKVVLFLLLRKFPIR